MIGHDAGVKRVKLYLTGYMCVYIYICIWVYLCDIIMFLFST